LVLTAAHGAILLPGRNQGQREGEGGIREESQGREEERREVIKASHDSPNPLTNL